MRKRYEHKFLIASPSALAGGEIAEIEILGHTGWRVVGLSSSGEGVALVAFEREIGDEDAFEEAAASIESQTAIHAPPDELVDALGREVDGV